jgi:ABC-2 type transport system permease protein
MRSEVIKLRTVWSTWLFIAIVAVVVAGLGVLVGFAPRGNGAGAGAFFPIRGSAGWFDDIFSVMSISQILALVLGIIVITGEFRHRTVTPTFLAEPRRGQVVASKMASAAGAGLVLAAAGGFAALVVGFAFVAGGDGSVGTMLGEFGRTFPGVAGACVLYALYGLGLGSLVRNQVVALVIGLAFGFVVEPIIEAVLPAVGKYLPARAAQSLYHTGAEGSGGFNGVNTHLLPWEIGVLVLLAWAVVLAGIGAFVLTRTDIT